MPESSDKLGDLVLVSFRSSDQEATAERAVVGVSGPETPIAHFQKLPVSKSVMPRIVNSKTVEVPYHGDTEETQPLQPAEAGDKEYAVAGNSGKTETKGEGWQGQPGQLGQDVFVAGKAGATEWGSLVEAYQTTLMAAANKLRRYPPLAKEQGWQGVVFIRISWDGLGVRPVFSLEKASSYQVLDTQASVMMEQAVRRFPLPDALKGHSFSLLFPIEFTIQDP